jgi:transketolase
MTTDGEINLNHFRKRLLRMHFESGVGHVGGNLSAIDSMIVIFKKFLNQGDDFILSKGHSAGALYIALWSSGQLSDNDLLTFHKDDTLLPGHPPAKGLESVLFSTGSLGHGLSLAAGAAVANKLLSSSSVVFCFMSDGEWQEGSTWEALIFACHHNLNNLTVLIDDNGLQGFGTTSDVASMNPLELKLSGFDIDLSVVDGHVEQEIAHALNRKSADKVRVIILKTIKANGIPSLADRMESHYLPLSKEQYELAVSELDK